MEYIDISANPYLAPNLSHQLDVLRVEFWLKTDSGYSKDTG